MVPNFINFKGKTEERDMNFLILDVIQSDDLIGLLHRIHHLSSTAEQNAPHAGCTHV